VSPGGDGYGANATAFRGRNGEQFSYTCPKYGAAGSIWGTDVYTDDSSVCTAGVHAGTITLAGGGTVIIEIRPGEAAYTSSTRNRITSNSFGAWSGSFVIVGGTANDPGVGDGGSSWDNNAAAFRTFVGARFLYNCPANGTLRTVWGTDIYTDDSGVCTAAVHAGLIKLKTGGKVTIEMLDGQPSYRGSKRNGVTTNSYGVWGGSFFIVGAPGGPDDPTAVATGDVFVNGQRFTSGRLKYGSSVDVTKGTLQFTAKGVGALKVFGDGTDPAQFKLKKTVQKVGKKKRTTADLVLTGGDFDSCAATGAARAAANQKTVRSLWGTGKGRFRTRCRFASATVRGTEWLTEDRCDGTLTTVKSGAVVVNDLVKKKAVTVKAPNSYLAAAR
jgi:LCCL domain